MSFYVIFCFRKSKKRIGDLMKQNAPFLKMYSEYMKNFDNAMNLINQWSEKSAKFLSLLQEIQVVHNCSNEIGYSGI